MSDTGPKFEVLPPPGDKVVISSPEISVNAEEAAQILEELGLIQLEKEPHADRPSEAAGKKAVGFDVRRAIKLGAFVEENAVRVDNGKIFVADQILLSHLMRLNEKAKDMKTTKELSEIAYPIGYLASQVKKTSKSTIVVEAVQGGAGRPSQPSWKPGEKVLPSAAAS